jgi:hypothetical protein
MVIHKNREKLRGNGGNGIEKVVGGCRRWRTSRSGGVPDQVESKFYQDSCLGGITFIRLVWTVMGESDL